MAQRSDCGILEHMIDLTEAYWLGRWCQDYGWLVPAGSVEALAEAIDACLQLVFDCLAAMGNACRQSVSDVRAIDRTVEPLAGWLARGRLS